MGRIILFVLVALPSCSDDASTFNPDAGGDDAHTERGDVETRDGLLSCGTQSCGANELCIHPCCGGALPACEPVPDSGACPPGSTFVASCPNSGGSAGCQLDPCTPPPPYCSTQVPTGCQLGANDEVTCLCA